MPKEHDGVPAHERRTYRGIVYANAYAVTRHYGGPEEGGWWYNAGLPLASMPIPSTFTTAHERDEDGRCDGCYTNTGEPLVECGYTGWEADANAKEHAIAYLKGAFADVAEGNIYSVLGGVELSICIEPDMAQPWPRVRPHYE